ncbi:MAG: SPFH domain-containing protein [Coriobacteriales bacterium]|jgi:regulator of protease activity HflC (stomatin/prohibitin superfamily)
MEIAIAIIVIILVILLLKATFFIVHQQEVVIIERLGKFRRIVTPGFKARIPVFEHVVARVSLRTMKEGFKIDAKTLDNVTITLEVSAQYHVDFNRGNSPMDSGIYRSHYTLAQPIDQMHDYIADALRSAIPKYTLDEVFEKKDDIARDVNLTVSQSMSGYGWVLVNTLITGIGLPPTVEQSMNDINAAQRQQQAAQSLANADKIKRVTEAQAEAEAMEKTGRGIAAQRIAIADGIAASLDTIQKSGVSMQEANELFLYTQWTEMMIEFAKTGRTSTVVLPADFEQSRSMFDQMLSASAAHGNSLNPNMVPNPTGQR